MSDQDNGQVSTLPRPITDDPEAWKAYWKEKGWPWRTEPEIDADRQKCLAERRAIVPDIKQGLYPFKDIKLSRADVEWLLATHENGRGAVDCEDENQLLRRGLDLRGANLHGVILRGLPLARMLGGMDFNPWTEQTSEQLSSGLIHLEKASLRETHLEEALLGGAHLEKAILSRGYLERVDLNNAHLEGATLKQAYMQKANLENAHLESAQLLGVRLEKANLHGAHLEYANLNWAHLEAANLNHAHLAKASLIQAYLERAYLGEAHLEQSFLNEAHLEGTVLTGANLAGSNLQDAFFDSATKLNGAVLGDEKHGFASLADVHWNDANLTVIKWSEVKMLGEEYEARQKKRDGKVKNKDTRLSDHEIAVRANRQLANALQAQGLNEVAARFAYRAQVLQRRVFGVELIQEGVKLRRRGQALGGWLFSCFLYLLAGYGYRPGRSVIWYLVTIFGFALAYFAIGHLPFFPDAFVFSLTSFHGRGFFPGLGSENSLHNPLVIIAAFEAVIGLLIEISFIATFTQRFFGR